MKALLPSPLRILGATVNAAARCPWRPWKNTLIRLYMKHYRIDLRDCEEQHYDAYPSFDAFFTRKLKPSTRPPPDPATIACPIEGSLQQYGTAKHNQLLQAKGLHYTIDELLGDPKQAAPFHNGPYATLYLAPKNYHRVHLPLNATLRSISRRPGRLLSVQPSSVAKIPRLYAQNERMAAIFESNAGLMALVMVGATCVGRISINHPLFQHQLPPANHPAYQEARNTNWQQTEEFATFHLGSCVILLFQPHRIQWSRTLQPQQPLHLAQPLGTLLPPGRTISHDPDPIIPDITATDPTDPIIITTPDTAITTGTTTVPPNGTSHGNTVTIPPSDPDSTSTH